jgi:hypothetical protein
MEQGLGSKSPTFFPFSAGFVSLVRDRRFHTELAEVTEGKLGTKMGRMGRIGRKIPKGIYPELPGISF